MSSSGATDVAYTFRGHFLEACDCQVLCPCWTGEPPDQDVCNGVFAWDVKEGELDGEPLPPFRVISISHHAGNRADARQQVAVFVDFPDASPARLRRLVHVFAGRGGGPLQDIGSLLGELVNDPADEADDTVSKLVERDIRLDLTDGSFSLTAHDGNRPPLVETSGQTVRGQRGQPITLTDSSLSEALGTQGEVTVARSDRFQLFTPNFSASYWLDLDIRSRSATFGAFSYESGT